MLDRCIHIHMEPNDHWHHFPQIDKLVGVRGKKNVSNKEEQVVQKLAIFYSAARLRITKAHFMYQWANYLFWHRMLFVTKST